MPMRALMLEVLSVAHSFYKVISMAFSLPPIKIQEISGDDLI